MKKIIILIFVLCLNIFVFSQIKTGINFNSGINIENMYNNKILIPNTSKYAVSFEGGTWFAYDFSKKISINTEINFFNKNAKIDTFLIKYNFIEIPVYLTLKFGNFEVLGGVSNGFPVNYRNNTMRKYTISSKFGIGYSVNNFLSFKAFYNQELISHIGSVISERLDQKNYFNSFMFGAVIKLFEF